MTEELIKRFFKKDCTAEEALQVVIFLKNHPEVVNEFLSEEEWEESEPVQMDDEFWNEVWNNVQEKKKNAPVIWLKRIAVAASIAIVCAAGYNLFYTASVKKAQVAESKVTVKPEQKILLNNSQEPMSFTLPDNSHIILSPASVIVYNIPFEDNRRDVSLEGKARFSVAKDTSKPFTVFAGGLATTAVGTEFTINTREKGNNNITVKLHNGKVVIKPSNNSSKIFTKNIYLEPGQQLDYNETNLVMLVGKIRNTGITRNTEKVETAKKTVERKSASTAGNLSFVNSPLPEVIDKLAAFYKVSIDYTPSEINQMNFTGNITKSDSLNIVLKVISQMNGLEMTDDNGKIKLKKQ